jgi:hypothetical protein
LWLTLTVAGILACTLFPFRFDPRRATHGLALRLGPDKGIDVLENIVLYLPAGFAFGAYLTSRGVRILRVWGTVVSAAFALSYTVEVVQHFLPGRFSSLTDVLSNTAGAALGLAGYRLLRRRPGASRHSSAGPPRRGGGI